MIKETLDTVNTLTLRPAVSAAKAQPTALLAIVHPPELVRRVILSREIQVFGRQAEDRASCLEHNTVSRRHLAISWDGPSRAHVAKDLDSHNGTWLNGAPLGGTGEVLSDGDVLRFGGVVAVYERLEAGMADAPGLLEALPGGSPAMARVRSQVAMAGPDPSPVLVVGQTGAGKEHVVRALHQWSLRRGRLLAINVAELAPQLVESQLFGHVRGAFTGADQSQTGLFRAAEGGTLFLDEIGELPAELQPKLLRVIQEGEVRAVGGTRPERVDVRIVAATNRDLRTEVEAGRFRRDLWARLSLWELSVPPLSRRRGDLMEWVSLMHKRWCATRQRRGDRPLALEPKAVEALLLAPWLDNLRGVDRVVHRLSAEAADRPISVDMVRPLVEDAVERPQSRPPTPERVSKPKQAAPASANDLLDVLGRFGGSVRAAARWYGRDRRQIYRWMDAFGVARSAVENTADEAVAMTPTGE